MGRVGDGVVGAEVERGERGGGGRRRARGELAAAGAGVCVRECVVWTE